MKNLLILTVAILALSSCSKNLVPYSQNIQDKYNISDAQMKQVQFYTSNDILIFRNISDADTEVISGKIKIQNGREVEEVVIPKGTPGVIVWDDKEKRYGVSFDAQDSQFLTFGPNPKKANRYYLMASEWNQKIGTIKFNGQEYKTTPRSADVYLMVDLKKIDRVDVDRKVLKGRTVSR